MHYHKKREIILVCLILFTYFSLTIPFWYQVPVDVDSYYTSKLAPPLNLGPFEFKYKDNMTIKRYTIHPVIYSLFFSHQHFKENIFLHRILNLTFILLVYLGSRVLFPRMLERAVFIFSLILSPYFLVNCSRTEGDTLIIIFIGLFFLCISKLWVKSKNALYTILLVVSVLFSLAIHPMGFALFTISLLIFLMRFKGLTLPQKNTFFVFLTLIILLSYIMGALSPSNIIKEFRFLRGVVDTNPTLSYYTQKYLLSFTPANYNITDFFKFLGLPLFLGLRNTIGWLQAIMVLVGAVYLAKEKAWSFLVWYLVPLILMSLMGLVIEDYFIIVLPIFFVLLTYGSKFLISLIKNQTLKRVALILVIILVIGNLFVSIYILNISKRTEIIYRERDPKITWLFPSYSIIVKAKERECFVHQIGGDERFIEHLFLEEIVLPNVRCEEFLVYTSKQEPIIKLKLPKSRGYVIANERYPLPSVLYVKNFSFAISSSDLYLLINPVFDYFANYTWAIAIHGEVIKELNIKQCAFIPISKTINRKLHIYFDKRSLVDITTISKESEALLKSCVKI